MNLSLVVGLCNQLSWSHLVLSPWLSRSALSCLTQSFCQTLAPSSSSFKLSAPMFLKEAYSCTLLLHSWWATGVVFTFSFNSFSFISFLVSSLRHILLARCITASNLPRSVHLMTRVSKPYSRTGFRNVSMRRPLFLSVNFLDTKAGLRRNIAILVLEMRALIALSALPSDAMMLPRYSKWLTCSTCSLSTLIGTLVLFLVLITILLVFSTEISNWANPKAFAISFSDLVAFAWLSEIKARSSAYAKFLFSPLVLLRRKSKRMINNSGPKTHPCLTPRFTTKVLSLSSLPMGLVWSASIKLMISPGIPKSLRAINSTSLSIESKAFFRSMKVIQRGCWFSILLCSKHLIAKIAWPVDLWLRNPNW